MSSMQKNRYQEMRERHQAEVNDFPLMFAVDARQFAEGLRSPPTKTRCAPCPAPEVSAERAIYRR